MKSKEVTMKTESKVDWWLATIILFLFVTGVAFLLSGIWMATSDGNEYLWFIFTGFFMIALIGGFAWPIYYQLLDDSLLVHFGIIRSRYEYKTITHIKPSRNPLSSPALSLDSLMISYSGKIGFFLISPKDKEGFMKDLASRTNHLEYLNGEVILKK